MSNNIITLTTDWGNSDNYAAIFKAHLYRKNPNAKIIDVTHDIKKKNIIDSAFLVKTMYHYYPKNSIHIIDVNNLAPYNENKYCQTLKSGQSTESLHFTHYLAFRYDEHYFMCENNGIISLLCNINEISEVVKILPNKMYENFHTFKAIPYWVDAATKLAKGENLLSIGEKYDIEHLELLKIPIAFSPHGQKDKIAFCCQYIDSYGNAITNLHKNFFEKVADGRTTFDFYCTQIGIKKNRKISTDYNDKFSNDFMLLFGHSQYLEICSGKDYAPIAKMLRAESLNLDFTITFLPKIEE
jgi:S-adenosylmethionine hydrolase